MNSFFAVPAENGLEQGFLWGVLSNLSDISEARPTRRVLDGRSHGLNRIAEITVATLTAVAWKIAWAFAL
jgi:hypothetical protein